MTLAPGAFNVRYVKKPWSGTHDMFLSTDRSWYRLAFIGSAPATLKPGALSIVLPSATAEVTARPLAVLSGWSVSRNRSALTGAPALARISSGTQSCGVCMVISSGTPSPAC